MLKPTATSVTLPREMVDKVREKVAAGEYLSNSALIRDALRLWQEREAERELAGIRDKIARSLNDPRPSLDDEDAFAYLNERFGGACAGFRYKAASSSTGSSIEPSKS